MASCASSRLSQGAFSHPERCASSCLYSAQVNSTARNPAPTTTAYTSLVRLPGDREKYVILYDQLAQGWVGPPGDGRPGQLHDADTIFAMGFTVPPI